MSISLAEDGESSYILSEFEIADEVEDLRMYIGSEQTLDGGDLNSSVEMSIGDAYTDITAVGTVMIEDALGDAPTAHFNLHEQMSDALTDDYRDIFLINTEGDLQTVDGLNDFDMKMEFRYMTEGSADVVEEFETIYVDAVPYDFTLSVKDTAAENGGVDTAVSMGLELDVGTGQRFTADFTVNTAEVPFDAGAMLADAEENVLTGDPEDADFARLLIDLMAMGNDTSKLLIEDPGLFELSNAFGASEKSDDAYSLAEFIEGMLNQRSVDYGTTSLYGTFEHVPVEEILERFRGTAYLLNLPEEYSIDAETSYIADNNSMARIAYVSEDGSKEVSLYLYYRGEYAREEYMLLSDDGATRLCDTPVVSLYPYDVGTYSEAGFNSDGLHVGLSFPPTTYEEAQELLSCLYVAK